MALPIRDEEVLMGNQLRIVFDNNADYHDISLNSVMF